MYFTDEFDTKNRIYITKLHDELKKVCECKVCVNKSHDAWSISAWYTSTSYMHKGYGKETLKHILEDMYEELGIPSKIEYIWNGSNQYVMDWLERNFDPVCKLPLAVLKNQEADDWDAHIYVLNRDKVIKYFNIGE